MDEDADVPEFTIVEREPVEEGIPDVDKPAPASAAADPLPDAVPPELAEVPPPCPDVLPDVPLFPPCLDPPPEFPPDGTEGFRPPSCLLSSVGLNGLSVGGLPMKASPTLPAVTSTLPRGVLNSTIPVFT